MTKKNKSESTTSKLWIFEILKNSIIALFIIFVLLAAVYGIKLTLSKFEQYDPDQHVCLQNCSYPDGIWMGAPKEWNKHCAQKVSCYEDWFFKNPWDQCFQRINDENICWNWKEKNECEKGNSNYIQEENWDCNPGTAFQCTWGQDYVDASGGRSYCDKECKKTICRQKSEVSS